MNASQAAVHIRRINRTPRNAWTKAKHASLNDAQGRNFSALRAICIAA